MAQATEWFDETFGIDLLPGLGGGRHAKDHLPPNPDGTPVEAFFVSTIVIGLAEIGDKTKIL
jgi:hypothetical protein